MRRRVVDPDDDPTAAPKHLRRFDPKDWGDGPDAVALWWDARFAWIAAGNDLVDVPATELPDEPFDYGSI